MKHHSTKRLTWLCGFGALVLLALAMAAPRKSATAAQMIDRIHSAIEVETSPEGPVVLTTRAAEFAYFPRDTCRRSCSRTDIS